jgi:RNA polymerase sigma-70 factor (ECF subfamily)
MEMDSDQNLIERALGGEDRALERLIQRHYSSVYRLAFRWCRNREDAEDIAQEVFVKMTGNLPSFQHRSAFSTWLCRIAINTAKDFNRKRTTREHYENEFISKRPLKNPAPSPETAIHSHQVYALLDRLPHKQKAAILLVFAEGLRHGEAAKVLQCSEATVSWRIFQGRKKLNQWMEKAG